jgi:hypothetical protein
MKTYIKNILVLVALFSLLLISGTESISAQATRVVPLPVVPPPTDYTLLEPIPQLVKPGSTDKTNSAVFLVGLFKLAIALAGALAVIMIIYGGFVRLSSDAISGQNKAHEIISNAIWGLLFAISAWLILYTINPQLVVINFNIKPLLQSGQIPGAPILLPGLPGQPPILPGLPGPIIPGESMGKPWSDDASVRAQLTKDVNDNVNVNKNNCAKIGDQNCTSVTGLSGAVVSGIRGLALECNCPVTVTGGTEYWLHGNRSTELNLNPTAHRPGGNVADLGLGAGAIQIFLKNKGEKFTGAGCSELGTEKYRHKGATYVLETKGVPPHWHACY